MYEDGFGEIFMGSDPDRTPVFVGESPSQKSRARPAQRARYLRARCRFGDLLVKHKAFISGERFTASAGFCSSWRWNSMKQPWFTLKSLTSSEIHVELMHFGRSQASSEPKWWHTLRQTYPFVGMWKWPVESLQEQTGCLPEDSWIRIGQIASGVKESWWLSVLYYLYCNFMCDGW